MKSAPATLLIGSGGHAAALLEIVELTHCANLHGIIERPNTPTELPLPLLGSDEDLPALAARGITHFILGIGSTQATPLRKRCYEQALSAGLKPLTLIHPSAFISPSAQLADGVQLMPSCLIHTGAQIGENTLINSGTIIEHHAQIGAHCHVASGACLTGGVRIGPNSFIGARAVLRQRISIGSNTTIGMGSVVTKNMPPNTTAFGIPARPIQP